MLGYFKGSTRPEISMSVHHCVHFCNNPRPVHERAVRRIVKYLASTSIYVNLPDGTWRLNTCSEVDRPDKETGIQC